MPTESDLRELLTSLEEGAPTLENVLSSLRSRADELSMRPQRRWLPVAAVAAVVLALVATISVIIGGKESSKDQNVGDSTVHPVPTYTRAELLPTWHFTVAGVPGYTVTRDRILRLGPAQSPENRTASSGAAAGTYLEQAAAITAAKGRVTGTIGVSEGGPVYQAVVNDQMRSPGVHGHALSIGGQSGYFSKGTAVSASDADPWTAATDDPDSQPQLTWRLTGGAYATITGTFGYQPTTNTWNDTVASTTMTKIAGSLTYQGVRQPVTMPFRLAGVHASLVPQAVQVYAKPAAQCLSYGKTTTSTISVGSNGSIFTVCRSAPSHTTPSTTSEPPPSAPAQLANTTLASRPLPDGSTLSILSDGLALGDITRPEAARLLSKADIRPALDRPTTWLPVT